MRKPLAKQRRYPTVMTDLEQNMVFYVAEDWKQVSLDSGWAAMAPMQRDGIVAIAMDMGEPYIQSPHTHSEDADGKVTFDKFHVAEYFHDADAADRVRRIGHRALKQVNDARLTGTKYLWLMRLTDMTAEQRTTFRTLQHTDFKVARAWTIKERFHQFWDYTYGSMVQKFFTRWFWWAIHSRLALIGEVATLIRGPQRADPMRQENGPRLPHIEQFKTAIYFHCGELDLYPHQSHKSFLKPAIVS